MGVRNALQLHADFGIFDGVDLLIDRDPAVDVGREFGLHFAPDIGQPQTNRSNHLRWIECRNFRGVGKVRRKTAAVLRREDKQPSERGRLREPGPDDDSVARTDTQRAGNGYSHRGPCSVVTTRTLPVFPPPEASDTKASGTQGNVAMHKLPALVPAGSVIVACGAGTGLAP